MDKQKGSFALVRQLMELKTNGIIATHDLLLGKLIEYFPKRYGIIALKLILPTMN